MPLLSVAGEGSDPPVAGAPQRPAAVRQRLDRSRKSWVRPSLNRSPALPKSRRRLYRSSARRVRLARRMRLMGALETFGWEWGSALLRWLHVTAAIAWIGGSFFFMHLDASLRKQARDDPALS